MPQTWVDNVQESPPSQDWGLKRVNNWKLKMCWAPKKCFISGKQLWGKYAYYGENWITGPGDPVVQKYWVSKEEFIIWQLKK
jgi:hypothetical protein